MPEKMRFDAERYCREAGDSNYLMAEQAFLEEKFAKAKELFERAYRKGNVLAGVRLGILYNAGKGCTENTKTAVSLFEEGMRRECPLGAEYLATAYQTGKAVPRDKEKAAGIFASCEDALAAMCEAGDADARYVYGLDLLYGEFVPKDEKKGLELLELSKEQGRINAAIGVAKAYLFGWGVCQDEQKGLEILEQYLWSSDRELHYVLGLVYYNGVGMEKPEYRKAWEQFRIAAEAGHVTAQHMVGFLHMVHADESLVNYPEAVKWLSMAADAGRITSLIYLADIYRKKEYEGNDARKAEEYLLQAGKALELAEAEGSIEGGNGFAYRKLADSYFEMYESDIEKRQFGFECYCKALSAGETDVLYDVGYLHFMADYESPLLPVDTAGLLEWIKKEEEKCGNRSLARLLGEIYDKGLRVPVNKKEAAKWNRIAMQKTDEGYGKWYR